MSAHSATTRIADLTRGWLPVGTVAAGIPTLITLVWWVAGQAHDNAENHRLAVEATAATRDLSEIVAKHTTQIAEAHESTAVIQAQLAAIRAQLDRIEQAQRDHRP